MTAKSSLSPPRWYWIVAGVAVLWMLFGVMALIMDVGTDEAALEQLSEAQRQLYAARPDWLFVVYAVATLGGLAGAIGLLLRQPWALYLLALSLAAVVVQFGYTFVALEAVTRLGPAAALPFPLLIFAIGAALLGFAVHSRRRGWL